MRCSRAAGSGIGFVGAVARIEQDYEFAEPCRHLGRVDYCRTAGGRLHRRGDREGVGDQPAYPDFKDEGPEDKLPIVGKALSLIRELGIYEGDYFERWYQGLLERKGKTKFGQSLTDDPDERYRYKVQVIAADLSDQRMLVLPRDLKDLVDDPDEFSIARAVRMSMSIPVFFEPVKLVDKHKRAHIIVDGGILSNYPVWVLDDGTPNPPWPTFGFKLTNTAERKETAPQPRNIANPVEFFKSLWDTMFSALDRYHISVTKGDYERSICIPTEVTVGGITKTITTTNFDITKEESMALYQNGWNRADDFIKNWDFESWKVNYRSNPPRPAGEV